jgi:hypothetical protein
MFDRDGDGQLSPVESAMAQAAFQKMRGGRGGTRGGLRGGVGGGGGGPLPIQPAMPIAGAGTGKGPKVNPLVKRFDADGDGKLNADEKATAQAELKKGKASKKKDGKDKDAKKPAGKLEKAGK